MSFPSSWITPPQKPEARFFEQAAQRQSVLTKPAGSLGRLENVAIQLAGLQGTDKPALDRVQISVFVGDHGICEEGISAYPQAVTAQMIVNFANGGAAISVLAKSLGAGLEVVNLGTVSDVAPDLPGVIDARIAPCTRNFAEIDAMTTEQVCAALTYGDAAAQRAADKDCQLFIGGEMGIGNTTSATAIACSLMSKNPMKLAGPGTGLDAAGVRHKAEVIISAVQRHDNDDDGQDAMAVLKAFGGFEIAALAGAIAGCAARSIPVLIDGYIVSVAALIAVSHQPDIRPWLLFAHRSAEPGHQAILAALNAEPLLDLGMRLGEGSGAAAAVPLLRIACELHNGMASLRMQGSPIERAVMMADNTTVFDLIRHGEPEGGPMYRGSKDDPLSDAGWQQMRDAISEADRWDAIVTSPMLRCVHFAQELADRYGIPLHKDERLREINFGEWEGRTADEVMASDGERLNRFWADPVACTPPGGEPAKDFNHRVVDSWHHWQQELAGQNVLIVCHGGVIRMIIANAMNIPLEHSFSSLTTPYACRSRIQVNTSEHGRFQSLVAHGAFKALTP